MENSPLISLVMPVYNSSKYLKQSIKSILNQTVRDFELIIIDDGSVDNSWDIINEFKKVDKRIVALKQSNSGLVHTLNKAIGISKGKYLARLDADDVSHPKRFDKQLKWFQISSKRVLCGTFANIIDENNKRIGNIKYYKTNHSDICKELFFHNNFVHSSVMINLEVLKKIGNFNLFFLYSQDYDCWCRILSHGEIGNIPEKLVDTRYHKDSISRKKTTKQSTYAVLAAYHYYLRSHGENNINIENDNLIEEILKYEKYKQFETHFKSLRFFYARYLPTELGIKFYKLPFKVIIYCFSSPRFFFKRILWGVLGNTMFDFLKKNINKTYLTLYSLFNKN